jgi:hypothetical protein
LRPAQFAASRTNGNVGQTSSTADCGTCHERTTKWETELRAQVLRRRLRPHRLLARP